MVLVTKSFSSGHFRNVQPHSRATFGSTNWDCDETGYAAMISVKKNAEAVLLRWLWTIRKLWTTLSEVRFQSLQSPSAYRLSGVAERYRYQKSLFILAAYAIDRLRRRFFLRQQARPRHRTSFFFHGSPCLAGAADHFKSLNLS